MPNQSEQTIQQDIRLAISSPTVRMFRNNVGSLRDENGRRVSYGLANGSADLIGFRTVTITQEMVGKQLAQFTSLEIKSSKGKLSAGQQAWLEMVKSKGGLAGVCRSIDDAKNMLNGDL